MADIGVAHAEGAKHTCQTRHLDGFAAQQAANGDAVERACTAGSEEREALRIVPALDAHPLDRVLHVLLHHRRITAAACSIVILSGFATWIPKASRALFTSSEMTLPAYGPGRRPPKTSCASVTVGRSNDLSPRGSSSPAWLRDRSRTRTDARPCAAMRHLRRAIGFDVELRLAPARPLMRSSFAFTSFHLRSC